MARQNHERPLSLKGLFLWRGCRGQGPGRISISMALSHLLVSFNSGRLGALEWTPMACNTPNLEGVDQVLGRLRIPSKAGRFPSTAAAVVSPADAFSCSTSSDSERRCSSSACEGYLWRISHSASSCDPACKGGGFIAVSGAYPLCNCIRLEARWTAGN